MTTVPLHASQERTPRPAVVEVRRIFPLVLLFPAFVPLCKSEAADIQQKQMSARDLSLKAGERWDYIDLHFLN